MTPQRLAEIENALRQAGFPPDVISHVMKGHLHEWYTGILTLVFLTIMLSGFAAILFLWSPISRIVENNARMQAEAIGAVLYDDVFGLSMVVAIFAWIFAAGALTGLMAASTRNLQINALAFAVLERSTSWLTRWSIRLDLMLLRNETNPARYVRKAALNDVTMLAVASLVPAAIGAFIATRELQSFSFATPTAYIELPFFPWNSTETHEWLTAVSVTVGCQHISRRTENNLIYTVRFADGAEASLGYMTPVHGSWLSAMEVIDQPIAASGARIVLWEWLSYDPLDPRCIDAVYERFPGDEFERLKRVMKWVEE